MAVNLKNEIIAVVLICSTILLAISGFIFLFSPKNETLIPFMWFVVVSTSFIGLPHEPVLIYFGKIYGYYLPVLASILPTILGCYIDYLFLSPLKKFSFIKKLDQNRFYEKTMFLFNRSAFLTIFIAALMPVPFYPVRLLAVFSGYSPRKYTIAVTAGRIPRFLILTAGGKLLNIPDSLLLMIFTVMLVIYILNLLRKKSKTEIKFEERKGNVNVS